MLHALTVQGVQHGVTSPVSCTRASVRLPALPKVQRLAAESPLVDLALVCAGEGQPVVLELYDSLWRLSAHVLDGVLRMAIHPSGMMTLSARLLWAALWQSTTHLQALQCIARLL